ncbi:MAG: BACON domain-containing protein [Alistipes sp.]|nr:BACON domain-containing protein [Alistipes sp.]
MNRLNHIFALIVIALMASCSKATDVPSVEFRDTKVIISAKGGEITVPVVSTGVDDVNIIYSYGDRWDRDEEGNLIPAEGWITLVKVIDEYTEPTRDLIGWRSGIVLDIAPNTSGYERSATLEVRSYGVTKSLDIVQTRN